MTNGKNSLFTRFAKATSRITGKPVTFILAVMIVIVWAVSGPIFGFSDTWQLVINTGTTIITFLMVFLIQNTQNSDTEALQLKIDELICALKDADDQVLNLEELDEKDLDEIRKRYLEKAKRAREKADEKETEKEKGAGRNAGKKY